MNVWMEVATIDSESKFGSRHVTGIGGPTVLQ